jgi:hypothetical protein
LSSSDHIIAGCGVEQNVAATQLLETAMVQQAYADAEKSSSSSSSDLASLPEQRARLGTAQATVSTGLL